MEPGFFAEIRRAHRHHKPDPPGRRRGQPGARSCWPTIPDRKRPRATLPFILRLPGGAMSRLTMSCSTAAGSRQDDVAGVIANEMGAGIRVTSGPAIEKAGDLAALLTNLAPGDILFIDEIHRLNRAVEEILYPAMEDFAIDIIVGKGRRPTPSGSICRALPSSAQRPEPGSFPAPARPFRRAAASGAVHHRRIAAHCHAFGRAAGH